MKISLLSAGLLIVALLISSPAAAPVVSNIRAAQIVGTKNVEILYDVSDADGGTLLIGVEMSGDGGISYTIPATALSGNVGAGVTPGANRRIVWAAGTDWNNQYVPNARARVTAYDGTTPVPPAGMAYVPAGNFQMGDNLDNATNALPVHTVTLSYFFMDRYEVTKVLWLSVQNWGNGNGYGIGGGNYKGDAHPVQSVTWYDVVKWCNARSQKEGLTPCYYTDDAQTVIYKTGTWNGTNAQVKWTANGYRLPTEAEWEKAARGGSLGQRFPWGNTISQTLANYDGNTTSYSYDSGPNGLNAIGSVGGTNPATSPVGSFAANNYGLYDMAGNVWEWCWDWYDSAYYGNAAANSNPRGPTTGTHRVLRGGAWSNDAVDARCAARSISGPSAAVTYWGFRCVRGL